MVYVSGSEKRDIFHFRVFAFISEQYNAVFRIAIVHFAHEIYRVLLLCVDVLVHANTILPVAYYGLHKL